ncbi:hypothetical protein C8J57DRAFT_1305638 [Mycena rebaudengoi]|nr:hypothetical protein C8J57DRAFT_1305638 [Mycena rebaudengoi]
MSVSWIQSQFSSLYIQSSPENDKIESAASLDTAFSPDAEIHLNHVRVERAAFAEYVGSRRGGGADVTMEFKPEDLVETQVDADDAQSDAIVAGKITLVRTHKFRIRAAPAKTSTVILFSARIKRNPNAQIVQLFQTSVDKPFQVNLSAVHHEA